MNPTRLLPCKSVSRRFWAALVVLGLSAACVTEDVATGKLVPRGDQKFPFEEVEEAADDLRVGMSKSQVLFLLGSPAEMSENGDEWVYLPERYAILIPARALHLEFEDGALAEHGFRPIVLGAQL